MSNQELTDGDKVGLLLQLLESTIKKGSKLLEDYENKCAVAYELHRKGTLNQPAMNQELASAGAHLKYEFQALTSRTTTAKNKVSNQVLQ